MFAAGDIIEWPEQKQAAKTQSHAGVIVKNVLKVLAGKTDALVSYGGSSELIIITNGKVSRHDWSLCDANLDTNRTVACFTCRSLADLRWATFGRGC